MNLGSSQDYIVEDGGIQNKKICEYNSLSYGNRKSYCTNKHGDATIEPCQWNLLLE